MTASALPTYADVVAAAGRLQGHAHRTPVFTSRTADEALGARLLFKCENLLTAPDAQLVEAMRFFAARMKLVVEPTGCLGLAGALGMRDRLAGKRVGVVLSGGNVDLERLCALLAPAPAGA